ncbi:MAG: SAP domain-containing protein [Candidatus Electrothrix sp. GM3_4]|nr:SAP domain-containing protein [Candidatus Electrothrix sp. GM3_4]
MNMKQVRKKATKMGIKSGKMKKADLIHAIQIEEKNSPCFLTANDSCDQADCCWKGDCLPANSN